MIRRVYINELSYVSAAGLTQEEILECVINGCGTPPSLDESLHVGPMRYGRCLDVPRLNKLGLNRKALRTMEKQASMAMWSVLSLEKYNSDKLVEPESRGLFYAIPSIEQAICDADAFDGDSDISDKDVTSRILQYTEPMSVLRLLNSSLLAHIAEHANITGAVGGFSDHADAGLEALIEAYYAIEEGDVESVLAGGISPVIGPWLASHWEVAGFFNSPSQIFPAEGAVSAWLSEEPAGEGVAVYLAGFGRCFDGNSLQGMSSAICAALEMANIAFDDLDYMLLEDPVVMNSSCIAIQNELAQLGGREAHELPILFVDQLIGHHGAAAPWMKIALSKIAFNCKQIWYQGAAGEVITENKSVCNVLISAHGVNGQAIAVILSGESTSVSIDGPQSIDRSA